MQRGTAPQLNTICGKKLNLTLEQLAEKINVPTAYIGFVERGERSLTLNKLSRLANVLGVSIDYLMSDTVTNLSSKEDVFLSLFSSATEEEQQLIIEMAKLILNHSRKQN